MIEKKQKDYGEFERKNSGVEKVLASKVQIDPIKICISNLNFGTMQALFCDR